MRDETSAPTEGAGPSMRASGETRLGRDVHVLLVVVASLTLATGVALLLWPTMAGVGGIDPDTQRPRGNQLWPWSLRTPLNSRFFGAFFTSVGVGATLALREPSWERIRVLFPLAIAFTSLGTLIALLHVGSFNPARLATWLFFILYIGVLLAELAIYLRYERRYRQR